MSWAGRELIDRLDACYERCTSENCKFFLLVLVFFSMVLVLPMMPLLLFVLSDRQPSVNPQVFQHLYNLDSDNSHKSVKT